MEKFNDWNEVEAKGMEDYKYLEMGAYECIIKSAGEHTAQSGNKSLKVTFDVNKGDFKNYFQEKFDRDDRDNKKWDNNATKYFGLGDSGKGFFKGFITSVENSNGSFKFDFDESKLVGKKIACSFEPEENEYEGKTSVKIKINKFRSLDKLKDIVVGNIKLLNGNYIPFETYNKPSNDINNYIVTDDDLPFDTNLDLEL